MFPIFGYMNVEYNEMSFGIYCVWLCVSCIPIVRYGNCNSISSFFCFFIYLFIYVPCVHALFVSNGLSSNTICMYSIAYLIIMLLLFNVQNKTSRIKFIRERVFPFYYLEILGVLLLVIIMLPNIGNIRFVNFLSNHEEMYNLRAELSSSRGVLTGYVLHWLKGGILPILFTKYLKDGLYKKLLLCVLAYFILYMLDMQKITFLMPLILYSIYKVLHFRNWQNNFHIIIMTSIIIISILIYNNLDISVIYSLAAVFILRTICCEGWLATYYYKFFVTEGHPFTYYSHINIVNFITEGYPYNEALGRAVSNGGMNANACFLITDGIAAAGVAGIFIIGIIFCIFLFILNSVFKEYDLRYVGICFIPAIISLLNVSFFTSILTSGIGLIVIIFIFFDVSVFKKYQGTINNHTS